MDKNDIRVLIIDDSAYNRKVLGEILEGAPGITVVGKARDGEEGLRQALTTNPDVITLDLEMPRMDGFTFMRLMMAKKKIPVIVISAHSQQENVFRALELGALDFVAKPSKRISPEIREIRDEVVKKVQLTRLLRGDSSPLSLQANEAETVPPNFVIPEPTPAKPPLRRNVSGPRDKKMAQRIVAIASSTGGPAALTKILQELPVDLDAAVVIAQHMPAGFTATFAERLDRQCAIEVREVRDDEPLHTGTAYIAPGNRCVELSRTDGGLHVFAVEPETEDRYVPSADRLFRSAAFAAGSEALGIVLTGMGDDGSQGVKVLARLGAEVIAEDDSTAVISGMPRSAVATGAVGQVARLEHMAAIIVNFSAK